MRKDAQVNSAQESPRLPGYFPRVPLEYIIGGIAITLEEKALHH